MNLTNLAQPMLYRLHLAATHQPSSPINYAFTDPAPQQVYGDMQPWAVAPLVAHLSDAPFLEILVLPIALRDDRHWRDGAASWLAQAAETPPLLARADQIQVAWCPGRVTIMSPPAQAAAALDAVVDFAYFEYQLRGLEQELAAAWPAVEMDSPLAYKISQVDASRDLVIGERMRQVLARRLRHARIEPHLSRPPVRFIPLLAELGITLREVARCEERAATADGQIEVQEYIYEMASQRLGEYRHARQSILLEAIIVGLLAAEVGLLLYEGI